jgi:putative redox protein
VTKVILTISWLRIAVELWINRSIGEIGDENLTGKINARARIIQGYELILDNGRSQCSVADQPTETSPGLGPTPLELCVMSHAGCYATIAALTAKKMRLQLKGCEVKLEAAKNAEVGTITEEAFDILFRIDAPDDKVRRLHDVTLKNCPVGILFERAGVKITYKLHIQRE